jgi:hypothetical protein
LSFGDDVLKNLYTTNGAGTYTRALGQDNWTKL